MACRFCSCDTTGASAGRIHQFEQQEVIAKQAITDQLYVAVDLLHGMAVVLGKVRRDADQAWRVPVDTVSGFMAQLAGNKPLEITAMIHQPVEVEQALVDHVLAGGALVFQNNREVVFIKPEGIDTSRMGFAGGVFGGQKTDAEQGIKVGLDQGLQRLFQVGGVAL